MLLEKGAKRYLPDAAGQVRLHHAALSKGEERYHIIDTLSSDAGEHINAQDEEGRPPIFNVLDTPECVALLLSHGTLPSLCGNDGRTAIHHVCIEDQVQSLKLLLGALRCRSCHIVRQEQGYTTGQGIRVQKRSLYHSSPEDGRHR
jgi:ankyrin repeat protein